MNICEKTYSESNYDKIVRHPDKVSIGQLFELVCIYKGGHASHFNNINNRISFVDQDTNEIHNFEIQIDGDQCTFTIPVVAPESAGRYARTMVMRIQHSTATETFPYQINTF